jgi:putative transposase
VLSIFSLLKQHVCFRLHTLRERALRWIKPSMASLALSTFADLTKSKAELLAENALLRQQLIILRRQVKRPVSRKTDRLLLVLLARMVRAWKQALFLVQPETLLRWHRELFRVFWKHKSKGRARKPRLSFETISLGKRDGDEQSTLGSRAYSG